MEIKSCERPPVFEILYSTTYCIDHSSAINITGLNITGLHHFASLCSALPSPSPSRPSRYITQRLVHTPQHHAHQSRVPTTTHTPAPRRPRIPTSRDVPNRRASSRRGGGQGGCHRPRRRRRRLLPPLLLDFLSRPPRPRVRERGHEREEPVS